MKPIDAILVAALAIAGYRLSPLVFDMHRGWCRSIGALL